MYDVAIIGGGINGCGIARDAAGRGYSVFLAEKRDLASGTSSGSTKLIHGGLRYLEHYEFRLVREALRERETLWAIAPHIIRPMRFVLPHATGLRPAWLLRFGLFFYDHIGGRKHLPATRRLDLRRDPAGEALKPGFATAFEFSDCWVDDARLVVLNAVDAAEHGAVVRTRAAFERIRRTGDHWTAEVRDQASESVATIKARLIVNAAGPWVDKVLGQVGGFNNVHNIRLVQGSHIVVPRLFDHGRGYLLQNADGRIFFAIPYENDFTLIGTTDRDYHGTPDGVSITADETRYICAAASAYFKIPVKEEDVVWAYSAVRPLLDDGASKAQEATRDYVLKVDGAGEQARLINIFGGKITTYRRLAEAVLDRVDDALGRTTKAWTGTAALPGGDFAIDGYAGQLVALNAAYPFLDDETCPRLVRSYGTRASEVLGDARSWVDLEEDFGGGLTAREVRYLQATEWAQTADDILWRRSKLGLRFGDAARARLGAWLSAHPMALAGMAG
jgi:glycerol-3-phosphate dehydrogenase